LQLRWFHERGTRQTRVDYPLVTVVAVRHGREVRFEASGLFSYPASLSNSRPVDFRTGGEEGPAER
jgi:hypothetical protein